MCQSAEKRYDIVVYRQLNPTPCLPILDHAPDMNAGRAAALQRFYSIVALNGNGCRDRVALQGTSFVRHFPILIT